MFGAMEHLMEASRLMKSDSTPRDENELFAQPNAENSNKLRGEKRFEKIEKFSNFPN